MYRVSSLLTACCVLALASSSFGQLIPQGLPDGVDRIKADTAIFVDQADPPRAALGNWEPYSSVLGNSHFLISTNKYAENLDDPFATNQSYGVAIQPVDGSDNTEVESFWGDDGFPYDGPINNYRQNGNPSRVAGDKRPGGSHYITGGEASPDEFDDFRGDDRFENITRNGRYGTIQTFNYDGAAVTPTSFAIDAVNGRFADDADLTGVGGEIGRFGGELAGLSNGNFLAVVDDKAGLHNFSSDGAAVRAATAVIVSPTGEIVKDSFVICAEDPVDGEPCGNTQIWSNVAAGNGFFCARVRQTLVFHDNDGNRLGAVDQAASGMSFDGGRGDGTRIAGHPSSNYIVLAGGVGDNNVGIAAFDGRTQSFVAAGTVNEAEFNEPVGRTGVAIDALDRIAVCWDSTPAAFEAPSSQVVCRVLSFNGDAFDPLTPTFFPFVNFYNEAGAPGPIETRIPNVSMTTSAICVAAKGTINLDNMPQDGGNSVNEQNFYTVFSHPAVPGAFIPGHAEEAGLARIAADTAIFVDTAKEPRAALGNWEPYSSVLGNSHFLVSTNKYAENLDDPFATNQSYGIAIAPVDGSANLEVESFYGDDGFPYDGPINNYRQNGNPSRVAGDKRPGAAFYITGGEASPDEFDDFRGDDRFENITRNGRYGTIQTFSYLAGNVAAASFAIDAVNGRFADDADLTGVGGEIGRFGGELAGLSNGNFLAVVDDKAGLHNFSSDGAAVRAATAVIVSKDGEIVKDSFVICAEDPVDGEPCGNTQIWSNVAAGNGFFCARVRQTLVFHDNDGNRLGAIPQAATGMAFDGGRGDGTRIAGHPNSNYICLAGGVGNNNIGLAVFDGRDQSFVAATLVNEENYTEPTGRTGVAIDALDRIAVCWDSTITAIEAPSSQVVARVLAFGGDGGAGVISFAPLTPTFLAFVNHYDEAGAPGPIETRIPNISMTTQAICIAAKGTINLENMPQDGGNSVNEQNFYTIFSHPDPQADPTALAPAGPFVRGDCNGDGSNDLSDGVALLNFAFLGGDEPPCRAACDFNADGALDVTAAVYWFNFLFQGGSAVPEPTTCGFSEVDSDNDVGCEDTTACTS